ncbi:hypothetical protein QUC31_003277 [Theobroma cacao]
MEFENPRLFIGGISEEVKEETLRQHFSKYGEVTQSLKISKKGIGFVTFADPSMAKTALQEEEHIILGRKVDVKPAKPRVQTKDTRNKIFVGGLPPTITLPEFRNYFESYGTITDAVVIYDKKSHRFRGFGFVTFDSEEAAENVLLKSFHELNNKMVEVKKAEPRDKKTSNSDPHENGLVPLGLPYGIYNVNTQPNYFPAESYLCMWNWSPHGGQPPFGSFHVVYFNFNSWTQVGQTGKRANCFRVFSCDYIFGFVT